MGDIFRVTKPGIPWPLIMKVPRLGPAAAESLIGLAFDLRHPQQLELTTRATKTSRAGLVAHARRFLRAHGEHAARLRSPPPAFARTPIVLVAVNTTRLEDERHPAMRFAISRILTLSSEFRLICLTVIPSSASSLEHLVELRQWVEPLGLPVQRLSLHAVESDSPADVIVELARYNNVSLLVIGAPSAGGRAWSRSTAPAVTARVACNVHVVRVPKR